MNNSTLGVSPKNEPPNRTFAEKIGITLVSGGKMQGGDLVMALVMFMPAFLVLVFLGTYPIISAVISAFQRTPLFDPTTVEWVGLHNFISIFQHPQLLKLFETNRVHTLRYQHSNCAGIVIALLLSQEFTGRNILRGLVPLVRLPRRSGSPYLALYAQR